MNLDPGASIPIRGERELLRLLRPALREGITRLAGPVGFGDDMAPLLGDPPLLWTVDMLMDGVDFDSRRHAWPAIGRKAMAVNLSDCAAMAATPIAALCAVSLSNRLSMDDALGLARGAAECGERFGCPMVGGDTNSWDAPTVIAITVAARCDAEVGPVPRDGARPGDGVWLSGPVGGSILGRHMSFEPRLALAREIAGTLRPHAMIDISDGLALDLGRILEASGAGAVLESTGLDAAIHADAHRLAEQDGVPVREHALYDGEDFELIISLPPDADASAAGRLGLLRIGEICREPGLRVRTEHGAVQPFEIRGWEHFR